MIITQNNFKHISLLTTSIKREFATIHQIKINSEGNNPNFFRINYYSDNFNNFDFPHKYFVNLFLYY